MYALDVLRSLAKPAFSLQIPLHEFKAMARIGRVALSCAHSAELRKFAGALVRQTTWREGVVAPAIALDSVV